MICRIRWTQGGTLREATCSGLADSQDGATAVLSRAHYYGPSVPVVVEECDEFGAYKAGQVLGFSNAASWWRVRDEDHRQALIAPANIEDFDPTHLILCEGRLITVVEVDGSLFTRAESVTCEACEWSLDDSDDRNLRYRGKPAPDAMIAAIVKPMRHSTPAIMDDVWREVRLRAIRKEIIVWERATVERSMRDVRIRRIADLTNMALAILRVRSRP